VWRTLIAAGTALVLGAVGVQLYAWGWSARSTAVGHRLVRQVRIERSADAASGRCTPVADGPQGVLAAPSIGLDAPVEQGTSDAVLSVAVGHDRSSVWPGAPGNAVLEAHDVSYFVHIDQLHRGSTIRYETPCATTVFSVTGHRIVAQGSPVDDTASATLTLVTCWPTDALWFTPDRYVVSATEVGVQRTSPRTLDVSAAVGAGVEPHVPAPAALVAEGLTLGSYSVPMGTLTIAGSPDPTWVESPAPLLDQDAAVEAFIAGVKAATQDHPAWWHAIAPTVTMPVALTGVPNPSYASALDVTVAASGTRALGVTLTTTMVVRGGPDPGQYAVTVVTAISHGTLTVTGWTLVPS
jgi:LPXTG-site transpeptidase (sortase) family protein